MLWVQFDAYVTDSVYKNIQVENEVAKQLSSKHIQMHLLYNSQFVTNSMQQNFSTKKH